MKSLYYIFAIFIHLPLYYFFYFKSQFKLPRDIQRIVLLPKFFDLNSADETRFVFRVIRKINHLLKLNNMCLHTSLVLFWLASGPVKFKINTKLIEDQLKVHVWVDHCGEEFSTDQTACQDSILTVVKDKYSNIIFQKNESDVAKRLEIIECT